MKNVLIVGHSHTIALTSAARGMPHMDVVNMKEDGFSTDMLETFTPDVVGLAITGNTHNSITLFEHPVPFTSAGLALDDAARVSIPKAQLRSYLGSRLNHVLGETRKMHARFPDARIAHICAPPPIDTVEDFAPLPETFEDLAKKGYAPNALRLLVYDLQTEYYAKLAHDFGAAFLRPPAASLTPEGMLAPAFCARDRTHSNAAYGALVIDQLTRWGMAA